VSRRTWARAKRTTASGGHCSSSEQPVDPDRRSRHWQDNHPQDAFAHGSPAGSQRRAVRALLAVLPSAWLKSPVRKRRRSNKLLEWSYEDNDFQRNKKNPLNCSLLICDEASMLDLQLADP